MSLSGKLDRQNSPSAKNLSLVFMQIIKLLLSNKSVFSSKAESLYSYYEFQV